MSILAPGPIRSLILIGGTVQVSPAFSMAGAMISIMTIVVISVLIAFPLTMIALVSEHSKRCAKICR